MIEFGATVNGETRRVYISDTEFAKWVCEAAGHGNDDYLDTVEMYIMNIEGYYFAFYDGASDDDYDVELEDRYVTYEDDE